MTPPLKPAVVFHHSEDPDVTAHVRAVGLDGKFMDIALDRELAYNMLTELVYHLRRQEKLIAEQPVNLGSVPRGSLIGKKPTTLYVFPEDKEAAVKLMESAEKKGY